MMIVVTVGQIDMQVHPGFEGKGPEKLLGQGRVESTRGAEDLRHIVHQKRAIRKVHGHLRQGVIHGGDRVAIAADPLAVSQGLIERIPKNDSHVFHGVVEIHLEVAFSLHLQIEKPVHAEKSQHMVEKGDPRGDFGGSRAVQVDTDLNPRLLGHSVNCCDSVHKITIATWAEFTWVRS